MAILRPFKIIRRWLDAGAPLDEVAAGKQDQIDWLRCMPLIFLHVACVAVIWVGWSPVAVGVAAALYLVRMFAITAFYHRYFSHRAFKTSRGCQFLFALLGSSAVQRGPLWWAAHHRHHHRHSDGEDDVHSPHQKGFLWSHILWLMSRTHYPTNFRAVPDLAGYRELRFLNRFELVVPVALAVGVYAFGVLLERNWPESGTNGLQMLIWSFFISTVALLHGTVTINSLAHVWGRKRYPTRDESRNNLWLALIILGEGWHNNHHYCPGATRQGFRWWEIDISYYLLRILALMRVIWDLNPVPQRAYDPRMPSASAGENA